MSYIIKILGTGCQKCKTLKKLTEEVITENNLQATIEKVEDIMKIMDYNVMTTPAIVVDEKVVVKGRIPKKEEILKFITEHNNNSSAECCSGSNECC